jgi:hypothetical protein
VIDAKHLIDAEAILRKVEPDIFRIFDVIGTTGLSRAQQEIVEAVETTGRDMTQSEIYSKYFFRRMSIKDFNEAVKGVIGAGRLAFVNVSGRPGLGVRR